MKKKKPKMIWVHSRPPVGKYSHIVIDNDNGNADEVMEWAKTEKTGTIYWSKHRTRKKPTTRQNIHYHSLTTNCRKKYFADEFYRYEFWFTNLTDAAYIRFIYG